ncbi:hypothetical protein M426DRAFT_94450 [Hypoxylon sp. CI-4A]|nr:hypothetical protein M426DRAFT_94450 [Hypoxylon sp. CI-4A]
MPYSTMTLSAVPIHYTPETRSVDAEIDIFHQCLALWLSCPIGQELYAAFMRLPLPRYINKVVCIDLGSIASKPAEGSPLIRHAIYRHAAALMAAEILHQRFGTMIQLFAQDTSYCPQCARVLFRKGFSVVGLHGAGGFAEIDDRTLVFAPDPRCCVREIVADVAEPAAMFWNTVLSPDEAAKASMSPRALECNDHLVSYYSEYEADPDSPRTRELIKNYEREPFSVTNLFGGVSLYYRKPGMEAPPPAEGKKEEVKQI